METLSTIWRIIRERIVSSWWVDLPVLSYS
jgi:hypothetical protein